MCGIAGVLGDRRAGPPALDVLRRMAAVLRHRGPDGYGFYRDDRIGLAHTRLGIVDLAGGAQPIANEDGTLWVTFNGEIFNHVELRRELEACGHRFATRSDTEVIVHGFEQWGPAAWSRFNGQFAFALWDARERRLWLVRDRMGILPLHYARTARAVAFASEAKAIFASGVVPVAFDPAGVSEVFTRWSATAPASVFAGVRSVPPATAIAIDEDLREVETRWWRADLSLPQPGTPAGRAEAVERLGERLDEAVRLRLRADVPVGAYLSGGLDSSVIAHLARSSGIGSLQTFAVRFENAAFDETPQQRRMAALLGTEHHEITCGDRDIRDGLPDVVWHCESPLLRTAPVPMFLLSDLVRRSGMKVVLTGEGADELLAGYSIFKEDKVRRFWARRPASTARPALLARVHPYVGPGNRPRNAMWGEFYRRRLGDTDHPFYSHLVRWENTAWSTRFLAPDVRAAAGAAGEADVERVLPPGWREWRPLARAQAIEIATFLSAYLLSSQGDRVAMGHGVEVRYPFLDPDVVDLCDALPDALKLRGLRDKVALREFASRHLPEDVWSRPKHPYRAPTTTALFAAGGDGYVRDLLSPRALADVGLVDAAAAAPLVEKAVRSGGRMSGEREEMALLGLLTLQVLATRFRGEFAGRVDEAVARLGNAEPDVLVDRAGAGRDPSATPRGRRPAPTTQPVGRGEATNPDPGNARPTS
jgi:asparagine synthase (glutamine-hydrolysing)